MCPCTKLIFFLLKTRMTKLSNWMMFCLCKVAQTQKRQVGLGPNWSPPVENHYNGSIIYTMVYCYQTYYFHRQNKQKKVGEYTSAVCHIFYRLFLGHSKLMTGAEVTPKIHSLQLLKEKIFFRSCMANKEKKKVCSIMICSFNIYPKINVAIRFMYTAP